MSAIVRPLLTLLGCNQHLLQLLGGQRSYSPATDAATTDAVSNFFIISPPVPNVYVVSDAQSRHVTNLIAFIVFCIKTSMKPKKKTVAAECKLRELRDSLPHWN